MLSYRKHGGKKEPPLHTMVGPVVYCKTRSRELLTSFNRIVASKSYNEVRENKNLLSHMLYHVHQVMSQSQIILVMKGGQWLHLTTLATMTNQAYQAPPVLDNPMLDNCLHGEEYTPLISKANVSVMRVGLLPVIPRPVTEYSTVRKSLPESLSSVQTRCDAGVQWWRGVSHCS